ncbi:MAG: hypothetical protein IJJ47_06720 [Methanosphaera sp.]|nr:hypothetical protein [Methanosphaera sp.]
MNSKRIFLMLIVVGLLLTLSVITAKEVNKTTISKMQKEKKLNCVLTKKFNSTKKIVKNTPKLASKENIIYVSSKGKDTNTGKNRNQTTTLNNAIKKLKNNTSIILTTTSKKDTYNISTSINITSKTVKKGTNFTISGDNNKIITLNGVKSKDIFTINGDYHVKIANINFEKSNQILNIKNTSVTVNNCKFIHNNATYFINSVNSSVNFTNNQVISNKLIKNTKSDLNSVFKFYYSENESKGKTNYNKIVISNNTFKNNNIKSSLIQTKYPHVTLQNNIFKKNRINILLDLNNANALIKNNQIDNNKYSEFLNRFDMKKVVFSKNTVKNNLRIGNDNQSGIVLLGSDINNFKIENSVFEKNINSSYTMLISHSKTILKNVTIKNTINKETIRALDSNLNINKFRMYNNKVKNTLISMAKDFYPTYDFNVTINNSVFKNNRLNKDSVYDERPMAGLINIGDCQNVIINNSSFIKNYCAKNGGIFYINSSKNNQIIKSTFLNNTSLRNGGNFYIKLCENTMINKCLFKNNRALNGGTILLERSDVNIYNSIFENNKANNTGGVLTTVGGQNSIIKNTNFTKNVAKYDGGVIFNSQSDLNITSSLFEQNNAQIGGAIYTIYNNENMINNLSNIISDEHTSQTTITNSKLINNKAQKIASAIYANRNLRINNNVLFNNNSKNIVTIEEFAHSNINYNWWGKNNPNFKSITNNIIPTNWRTINYTLQTKNNKTRIIIKINYLNNGKRTSKLLPNRIVTFTSKNAKFSKNNISINKTATNTFKGKINNTTFKIDNQKINLAKKMDAYMYSDDLLLFVKQNATIKIKTNNDLERKITIKLNDEKLTSIKQNNGKIIYRIPAKYLSTAKESNLTISYPGDAKYSKKEIHTKLKVRNEYNYVLFTQESIDSIGNLNETLPARYDLRKLNQVTPIKNQGFDGSCTDFAIVAALESAYLKQKNIKLNLSESHLRNLIKQYSTVGVVKNNGVYESTSGDNMEMAIDNIINWHNPIESLNDPYFDESIVSPLIAETNHIYDVLFIPKRTDLTNNSLIKQVLMKYGAIAVNINSKSMIYDSSAEESSLNIWNYESRQQNHAVTIVGWDDNYSRKNFKTIDDNGDTIVPRGDGAFIIKNSWGKDVGEKGYQYVSYYDTSLSEGKAFILSNNEKYDNNYHISSELYHKIPDGAGISTKYAYKNIYVAKNDEIISALGSYFNMLSNYSVNIFVNGKLVYNLSGKIDYAGYRTIKLKEKIPVYKNDKISIIINTATEDAAIWGNVEKVKTSVKQPNSYIYNYETKKWEKSNLIAKVNMYTFNKKKI